MWLLYDSAGGDVKKRYTVVSHRPAPGGRSAAAWSWRDRCHAPLPVSMSSSSLDHTSVIGKQPTTTQTVRQPRVWERRQDGANNHNGTIHTAAPHAFSTALAARRSGKRTTEAPTVIIATTILVQCGHTPTSRQVRAHRQSNRGQPPSQTTAPTRRNGSSRSHPAQQARMLHVTTRISTTSEPSRGGATAAAAHCRWPVQRKRPASQRTCFRWRRLTAAASAPAWARLAAQ